ERYFGEKYPFAKCDFVAVPEFWAGAMEHPGAITFNARLYLLDAKTASVDQKRYLAWTIAHELAHIWFGDLVTLAWWDDLWLNESFADWLSVHVTHEAFPELRLLSEELTYNADVLTSDARPTSLAIHAPVEDLDEMLQNLGVQYDKGRAVLGMFERWLGREPFRQGVLLYLSRHRWKNATAGDLWSALRQVSDRDVPAAMRTFLEQPGVPLITADVLSGGRVRLTRRRYTAAGVDQPPLRWQIPVVLRYADDAGVQDESVFLTQDSEVVLLPVRGELRWLYPNADASGYFRWSVSDAMLTRLLEAVPLELSERERVGLASNCWSLVEAGLLPGDRLLDILARLMQDEDPFVVLSALEELPRAREPFVTDSTQGGFAAYVRTALRAPYQQWGGESTEGLSLDAISLRPNLFAWLGEYGEAPAVRRRMTALADRYLNDPADVNAEEAAVALRVSAFDGDEVRFRRYRASFESAENPGDRTLFLRALGCFRRPALRDSALAYSLTGP
ncbi:MAG: M1 family metallopeptidase, partial [Candidatus Rokuibacteriota bacterium]